ncbi:hypothetical protein IRM63_07545 [Leuconostoc citreum]|uniref:hypothetical protein n=1 Tax=Leuconostoc citreum TaxID=33964 RepID=UPI001889BCEB|nr:hypothetical protein [Leuconostoc citreum]MCQ6659335.1 hypothetical protein [Leuconostoc citreum]QOY97337.1 hypothetical protein IRM63_07545 [Leuconostoc citreum]
MGNILNRQGSSVIAIESEKILRVNYDKYRADLLKGAGCLIFYQKSSVSRHLASFYDAAIGHQALLK